MLGKQRTRAALTLLVLLSVGCATQQVTQPRALEPRPENFGLEKAQAVEVCKPEGERAYLRQLVCASGKSPTFNRTGNVGSRHDLPQGLSEKQLEELLFKQFGYEPLEPGVTDYHVIDAYQVVCDSTKVTVYLDMYHCNVPAPQVSPRGFGLR